jgi:hypothetical protein
MMLKNQIKSNFYIALKIFLPEFLILTIHEKTAFSTNDAGTTGGYHVEECELIHSYLLVLR